MDLNFRPINLGDKELVKLITNSSKYQNCDFAFANICAWNFLYQTQVVYHDGYLLFRFWIDDGERIVYMPPIGKPCMEDAIRMLEIDAKKNNSPLCIMGVTDRSKDVLEHCLPNRFIYLEDRNFFDYIYLREDLVKLSGKKYQAKRNHINKFKKLYNYTFKPLEKSDFNECMELALIWQEKTGEHEYKESIHINTESRIRAQEIRALSYFFEHFDALEMSGGVLRVDDKLVAFCLGSALNQDTYCVHVEKAIIEYDGVYSMINQEYAKTIPEKYTYINREEDLGIEGLRKSKLSYHPHILLKKNMAVLRDELE